MERIMKDTKRNRLNVREREIERIKKTHIQRDRECEKETKTERLNERERIIDAENKSWRQTLSKNKRGIIEMKETGGERERV